MTAEIQQAFDNLREDILAQAPEERQSEMQADLKKIKDYVAALEGAKP